MPTTVDLPVSPLPPLEDDRLGRLGEYLARFREVFARADQARGFNLYVRGLLLGDHRKNVESIAEAVRDAEPGGAGLAQSLQHFVSQSPWDAGRLVARYRALVRDTLPPAPGILAVHDAILPKAGRRSVGVQRQFARALGRKVTCQLAVVVSHVGPAGYAPLAARLYLPASWLRENAETVAKTVPEAHREPVGKPEIALALLDELAADGWVGPVAAEDGYLTAVAFQDGLAARKRTAAPGPAGPGPGNPVAVAQRRFEWLKEHLGLNHFEGRTWVGWHHHVGLVFAAYGFLAGERLGDHLPPFPPRPTEDWSI